MIIKLLLAFLLVWLSVNKCSDVSSCFIKELFDFSFPVQNVYNIQLSSQEGSLDNVILGYGDFNSDLRSDYVAVDPNTNNLLVFFYQDGGDNNGQYLQGATIQLFNGCVPLNVYLYDANLDGMLDITVWGQYSNNSNCIYPALQTSNNSFAVGVEAPTEYMQTTQPILFESANVLPGIKTTCLMLYNSQSQIRSIIYYDLSQYATVNYSKLFNGNQNYNVPFSDQHWNSFLDITDDCNPDIIITNSNLQIEFWVYTNSIGFNLIKIVSLNQLGISTLTSLIFTDIDYDGLQELTLANETAFFIYPNIEEIPDQICKSFKTNFVFDWNSPMIVLAPTNCTLSQQNIHYADLNTDGYPDLSFICQSQSTFQQQLFIYENTLSKSNGGFPLFSTYQQPFNQYINSNLDLNVTRVSFFDVLENGIIDIMVTVNGKRTMVLYNNYLYQNYFYIKGFATNGPNSEGGTQIPGASFYWLNSLGNSQKRAVYVQLAQTAYGAVPMPYVLTGLGMANNYVEQFTVGRLGTSKSWSPIIPNSQLAVFSGGQKASSWSIKIFILPTDSIVYVLIVCIVILTIMGLVLLVLKCRHKKEENVLLEEYT